MPWDCEPGDSRRHEPHKALAIARILFEAQGYHPRALHEIEEFIGTTKANTSVSHVKSTEDLQALDKAPQALVHSLAERLHKADWWTDHSNDHDGRPSDDTAKSTCT